MGYLGDHCNDSNLTRGWPLAESVVSQMYAVKEREMQRRKERREKRGKKEGMRGCRRRTADLLGGDDKVLCFQELSFASAVFSDPHFC